MRRPEPVSLEAERRSETAADWLARRDRGLTAAEQDAFLQWLAADPRHGEWFALHRGTVADFTALAQWRPEHSAEPNPDLLAAPGPRVRWLAPTLLAIAAAIALAFMGWRAAPAKPESALVAAAELKCRILEDGSTVELNRGAVVTVEFGATERRVNLLRGEALFTVVRDPSRPFVVRAGGVDVRAVGTAFSVRLDPSAVEVLVTEGKVGVERVAKPSATSPAGRTAQAAEPRAIESRIVAAGERATVALASEAPPQIAVVSRQTIAQQLNWQPQVLDFSSAPLGVAVAEFNRRNHVQFVLADPALAALPVVASIRSDNVEGFAQFLAAAPGVQIERRGATEIVVSRKP
jgi:transmembrane sensor